MSIFKQNPNGFILNQRHSAARAGACESAARAKACESGADAAGCHQLNAQATCPFGLRAARRVPREQQLLVGIGEHANVEEFQQISVLSNEHYNLRLARALLSASAFPESGL